MTREDTSHGYCTHLCATPCSDPGGGLHTDLFSLLSGMERRRRAALAKFRRHRWHGSPGPTGLFRLHPSADAHSVRSRLRRHHRTLQPPLYRLCPGGADRGAIVRHAGISCAALLDRIPSESRTFLDAALRSGSVLYRLGFQGGPHSQRRRRETWINHRGRFFLGGIAALMAGATVNTGVEAASPLGAWPTDTCMGSEPSRNSMMQVDGNS